jgi:hypothetical protein
MLIVGIIAVVVMASLKILNDDPSMSTREMVLARDCFARGLKPLFINDSKNQVRKLTCEPVDSKGEK